MKLYELIPKDDGTAKLSLCRMHDAQRRCFHSSARFTFLLGGTQVGKTSFGPWWLWSKIREFGAGDYLAISATFPLFQKKMLREIREVLEHVLGLGRYWSASRVLELRDPETGAFHAKRQDDSMWGRVIMGSAEQGGSLESATANAAWIDECGQDDFGLDAYEAIIRRLSLSQGPLLGTTTLYNLGWIMVEVYERWLAGDPDYLIVHADSTDNPAFPMEEFERARRTLPAWKFSMMYRGRPDRPPGLIYMDYVDRPRHEGGHLVEDFEIPPNWPRFIGVDFGAVNTALVWIAKDPGSGAHYVFDESLEGGKTTAEHAAAALDKATGVNVILWAGGAKSETQQRMDWSQAGVPMLEPRVSDVEAGIDRVIAMWKTRQLFVFESCRGLRAELRSYSRVLDDRGQPTGKIRDKQTFHRLDALRYIVQRLDVPDIDLSKTPDWARAEMAGVAEKVF